MRKKFGGFNMPKFEKPASLKDIMSSDSSESDEEDPRAKGLTSAA